MDDKDRLLLQLLEENSLTPHRDLAEMLQIPESEISTRISALEHDGVIKKYAAMIDWEKAGDGIVLAVIDLKVSPERDYGYDRIAERIARFPQVRSLRLISGVYDLQLLVTGRNIHEITQFVSGQIAPIEHIRETATILIMKTYKDNGQLFFMTGESERLPLSF
jgi:DNA-binding Lrp family transcriptional regulator